MKDQKIELIVVALSEVVAYLKEKQKKKRKKNKKPKGHRSTDDASPPGCAR